MWKAQIQSVLRWARHAIREPREELDRWQKAARYSYDLTRYGLRQLREDRAPQMAAALAYQALFALVPVLVVSMIVVRGIIGVDEFLRRVGNLLEYAGLKDVTLSRAAAAGSEKAVTLQRWLEDLIGQAGQIDLRAVGWVGFALIVYASISMLVTIENSFNTIYRAPEGRPWLRRIPLYWFLITASPLAITLTAVLHGRVEAWAESLALSSWYVLTVGFIWSVSVGWLFWFAVYSLVPNTSVDLRAAAVGALVCVCLLEVGKRTLGVSISNAFAINQLYGSLGLIPLFMFWVYLMWLAVLFGLEVSATLQYLGDRALQEMETRRSHSAVIEPAVVVSVMQIVGEDFQSAHVTTQRRIADKLAVPERVAALIVQELCQAGLLHRVERDPNAVCLALPAEEVMTDRLLEIGFRLADDGGERWISAFASRLREQQRSLAAKISLASLLTTAG